jgi:hypothetical protein
MEFFTADTNWLFLAYVVGTLVGLYFGFNMAVRNLSEKIVDSLIEQKVIMTKGSGKNMEIIPYTEWCDDKITK